MSSNGIVEIKSKAKNRKDKIVGAFKEHKKGIACVGAALAAAFLVGAGTAVVLSKNQAGELEVTELPVNDADLEVEGLDFGSDDVLAMDEEIGE